MIRMRSKARPDWAARVASQGLTYHTHLQNGAPQPYWSEHLRYVFRPEEIDRIEEATAELHRLSLAAVDHVVSNGLLADFGVPEALRGWVSDSWRRGDPSLYGRMDLAYDGEGPPKLLEYNADTPTSVIETGAIQWMWMEELMAHGELPADCDQFNSLHDKLIARFAALAPKIGGNVLHLASLDTDEDAMTISYLHDLAVQGGLRARIGDVADIGWTGKGFVAGDGSPMKFLFKLYPWEWMFSDLFGAHLESDTVGFLEPPWKAILSHKRILVVLHDLFPGHPNLLEASLEPMVGPQAVKPMLGREGANINLSGFDGSVEETGGTYGAEGRVHQRLASMFRQDGATAQIGSWIVGDEPAGMCVREADGAILTDTARFVPHTIE